jgi:hypothetical protein
MHDKKCVMEKGEREREMFYSYGAANCEVYVAQVAGEGDTIMWHCWKMVELSLCKQ